MGKLAKWGCAGAVLGLPVLAAVGTYKAAKGTYKILSNNKLLVGTVLAGAIAYHSCSRDDLYHAKDTISTTIQKINTNAQKRENDNLEDKIEKTAIENEGLRQENEQLKDAIEQWKQYDSTMQQESKRREDQHKQEIETVKTEYAQQLRQKDDYNNSLSKDNQQLKEKVRDYNNALATSSKVTQELKNEVAQKNNYIQAQNGTIAAKDQELGLKQNAINSLQNTIKSRQPSAGNRMEYRTAAWDPGESSSTKNGKYLYYDIAPGDTLSQLGKRLCGDWRLGDQLAAENGIDDPTKLAIGTQIRVDRRYVRNMIPELYEAE